jgi:hypothetical protein
MKRNVSGKDLTVRFMIASGGIMMGLFAKRGWLKVLGFGIGGTELATAITRRSPLNQLLGRKAA